MSSPKQDQKPDFEKLYLNYLLDPKYSYVSTKDFFKAGCERIWNDYVIPRDKALNELKSLLLEQGFSNEGKMISIIDSVLSKTQKPCALGFHDVQYRERWKGFFRPHFICKRKGCKYWME